MRKPTDNKTALPAITTAAPRDCHRCGRNDRHCRPTEGGYWCARDGLVEIIFITPDPDRVSAAVANDPTVAEAWDAQLLAQAEYDKAVDAHDAALSALYAARLDARGSHFLGHLAHPHRATRNTARLQDAEQAARDARDTAAEHLTRAKIRHHEAQTAARNRLTT